MYKGHTADVWWHGDAANKLARACFPSTENLGFLLGFLPGFLPSSRYHTYHTCPFFEAAMLCGLDCRSTLTAGPSRCPPLSDDKVAILGQKAVETMLDFMGVPTMRLGDGTGDTAASPPPPREGIALFVVAASPTVPGPPMGDGAGGPDASHLKLGVPHATLVFIGKVQQALLGAGISVRTVVLPADPGVCTAAVEEASADPLVVGIIVGRPLPPGCSAMLACIAPSKDMDGAAPGGCVVSATAAGAAGVVQLLYRGPSLDRVVVIGHKGSVGSGVGASSCCSIIA